MTATQERARAVRATSSTVRVDALEELARGWMASSHRGSSRWACGESLLGVLAAATETTDSTSADGAEQR